MRRAGEICGDLGRSREIAPAGRAGSNGRSCRSKRGSRRDPTRPAPCLFRGSLLAAPEFFLCGAPADPPWRRAYSHLSFSPSPFSFSARGPAAVPDAQICAPPPPPPPACDALLPSPTPCEAPPSPAPCVVNEERDEQLLSSQQGAALSGARLALDREREHALGAGVLGRVQGRVPRLFHFTWIWVPRLVGYLSGEARVAPAAAARAVRRSPRRAPARTSPSGGVD